MICSRNIRNGDEVIIAIACSTRSTSTKPKSTFATIDEYLSSLTPNKRAALERLRKAVRAAAPGAEECISYGIPAFRLGGRILVYFGAAKNHCSFYPGAFPIEVHKDELEDYDTGKGTIRFQADRPLPAALVRKLVKTRIAENAARKQHVNGPLRARSTRT